ncbi:hypothetical protein C8J57DRAFT_1564359 [Mycena rebaudengoi]|nr:hypothetical protein C8J57DRAFT_1564359 [Mycena rebaudengoi]
MVALSFFLIVFFSLQSATTLDSSSCDSQCAAFNSEENTCNQTVIQSTATCYDCMIQIGKFSQAGAQEILNKFVQECDNEGTPVTNIILTAAGSGPGGAPPISVSGAKVTPAPGNTTSTAFQGLVGRASAEPRRQSSADPDLRHTGKPLP